jgi:UrcA family protein
MRRTSLTALAALSAALIAAAPVRAQDSVRVPVRDLNLASAQGQAALDQRIARAARRVCDTGTDPLSAVSQRGCVAGARTAARASAQPMIAAARSQQTLASN